MIQLPNFHWWFERNEKFTFDHKLDSDWQLVDSPSLALVDLGSQLLSLYPQKQKIVIQSGASPWAWSLKNYFETEGFSVIECSNCKEMPKLMDKDVAFAVAATENPVTNEVYTLLTDVFERNRIPLFRVGHFSTATFDSLSPYEYRLQPIQDGLWVIHNGPRAKLRLRWQALMSEPQALTSISTGPIAPSLGELVERFELFISTVLTPLSETLSHLKKVPKNYLQTTVYNIQINGQALVDKVKFIFPNADIFALCSCKESKSLEWMQQNALPPDVVRGAIVVGISAMNDKSLIDLIISVSHDLIKANE